MTSFNYEKIKNPMIYKENTLPAHSDCRIYKNRAELLEKRSSLVYSLDGIWKFSYAVNAASAIPGFEGMDYDCRSWEDIRVPAHIQLEGYDRPQYVDVQYPWDGWEDVRPGGVPERFNPVASYAKYFELPKGMKGKEIRIAFEGVESGMALWLNGSYVGYSEDSFTPSDFELTPYLREGENKLAVQVYKWTSSSWCEDQDFFRFSGIHRSVYLYAVPSIHLEDIRIKTLFPEDNFSKAVLEVQAKVKGEGKVRFALMEEGEGRLPSSPRVERGVPLDLEGEGKKIFERTESAWEGRMMAGVGTEQDKKEILIREEIPAPKLWSGESPYLYRLEIELCGVSGETEEYAEEMVGIRKFEMRNNRMLLNGRRIVFKGVNRQEFSSVTGRCASYEELEKDIVTMKRNNINAVRTSHYSNSRAIYDLCDRYGLYMIAECNMESHGTWDAYVKGLEDESYVLPGGREEWEGMMLDRATSCYQKDKNHPSVLIWSCGNESFGGRTIYRMSELFRKLDDTRLVHYEGICEDRRYPDTSDMESRMYRPVRKIKEYLETPDVRPYICCEYSHAMGNSCGGMHKYTDLADEENSGYQGGFLWDYIDQSLYKKDRYGKEFQAYGGDFHDRPNNGNFSGNGIVYGGERNASPKMQEVKYNYQNISVIFREDGFEVWNKNLFTSTDAFACQAVLQRNGVAISQKQLNISVGPESRKQFPYPFEIPQRKSPKKESFQKESSQKEILWREGEYAVTISFLLKEDTLWAKAGHEVAFGQAVVAELKSEENAGDAVKPPILIRGKNNIGIRGEEFQALFSMNGGLASYRYAGEEMLEKMPKPNFWRAPVDNDEGNNMAGRYAQWKLASLYLTAKGIGKERKALAGMQYDNPEVTEEADCVAIAYRYRFQTTPDGECQVTYRVYGDGRIRTTLSYDPVKELGDMPEFGMIFYCNADYGYVEWYGNGPAESYEDRKMGAKLGIYRNRVQDNMAEYLVPQECGNKTGVRYGKIMDKKGRGLLFTGDKMNFSALPYTPHEMEQAAHPYELPQIHYTVVRVSMQQMGVGGDNSWGALVHPEYLIDIGKKLEFTFTFRGI